MGYVENVHELRELAAGTDDEAMRLVAATAADAIESFASRLTTLEKQVLPREAEHQVGLP